MTSILEWHHHSHSTCNPLHNGHQPPIPALRITDVFTTTATDPYAREHSTSTFEEETSRGVATIVEGGAKNNDNNDDNGKLYIQDRYRLLIIKYHSKNYLL